MFPQNPTLKDLNYFFKCNPFLQLMVCAHNLEKSELWMLSKTVVGRATLTQSGFSIKPCFCSSGRSEERIRTKRNIECKIL